MVTVAIDAFYIEFKNSANHSLIVSHSNIDLESLAITLRDRKKLGIHDFTPYRFSQSKKGFKKISMKTFIDLTSYCTDLNVVLTSIYN